jgi:acyl-coenzyme A synthetase/AMP-(fatty) acid ligase
MNLLPAGVTGEIYIGGAGVARGYLNRPALTAERFVPNPFDAGKSRLYKTGDLARWLPDGNIEYIGRNDDQVKIRGYRIELAEIEHALSQVAGIHQCCVLAKQRKTESGLLKYLAAYYIPERTSKVLTPEYITARLSQILPEYMVPVAFLEMENFPLTVNGKLNKRAFPEPDFHSETSASAHVKPVNEMQKELCKIWQEVLGLKRVGISDDF